MAAPSSDAKTAFFGTGTQTARLLLYTLTAIVLMALDQRGQYIPRLRSLAAYLVEPVYHVVEWPFRAASSLGEQFRSRRALRHEIDRLEDELLTGRGQMQRLETLSEENRRLRDLLEGADALEYKTRFAELVRVDLDPFSHRVVINKGSVDEVEVGQAVVDAEGIMGQVEDVGPHMATIRLISDPNHALPVQINRTGLRAVAFGTGETGKLILSSIPLAADVREGDLIVTSGLGDRFPGGYPVAAVSEVMRPEGQTFAEVAARPLASLDRGREVLLVLPEFTEAAFVGPRESEAGSGGDEQP